MCPTSVFFNNYKNKQEQNLVEDLIHEAVKLMGFDAHYIPNDNEEARDLLFSDDPLKSFKTAYAMEVYLSNSVDPGMSGEFFSKFGLEVKNSVRILLPRRAFAKRVPQESYTRPREGDLVYIPFLSGRGELYEIKFVNDSTDFFTLGRRDPYYWELEMELFKYSHEDMDTGVEEIDIVASDSAFALEFILGVGSGSYKPKEIVFQSADGSYANSTCEAIAYEYDQPNSKLRVININGSFSNTEIIYGLESEASYAILNFDPQNEPVRMDAFDNKVIIEESTPVISSDEVNPFGSLGSSLMD